jgi:NTP pyrophosphatase (non-canonical NTP hydrolase)
MRADILKAIDDERAHQREKWGCSHPWGYGDCSSGMVETTTKVMVLAEECGEVARAVLDRNYVNLKDELVQVAAVAVAWLEQEMRDVD